LAYLPGQPDWQYGDRLLVSDAQEAWLAHTPQAVIYTPEEGELGLSGHNWLNMRPGGWVQVTTDGMKMWVEKR
jgi:hypothetical protein